MEPASHAHGWQVPFSRYVQLLYGVKSWSLDFDVTQEDAFDGSGNRQRLYGAINFTAQYFRDGFFAPYPLAPQMTAGTRRVVQAAGGADPLPYAGFYSEFPDKKGLGASMVWAAADYPDTIYHYNFQSFNPGGVYDDETFDRAFVSAFCLPCLAHPLLWQPDHEAPAGFACGFGNYGSSDMLVYLPGEPNNYNGLITLASLFGSTDHLDMSVYGYGEAHGLSTALDLSIDGFPVTATNSPVDHPFTTGYAHLTVSEWW